MGENKKVIKKSSKPDRIQDIFMENQLKEIEKKTLGSIEKASSVQEIEDIRIGVLGRKGDLTKILRSLGELTPEERGKIGKLSNEVKRSIETALNEKKNNLGDANIEKLVKDEWIDVTLDIYDGQKNTAPGRLHPITQIQNEIEDIFISMGFQILDGPEAETDYYNFEALNIPPYHPARDMQDTFWTEDGNLLRTHTSAIQVRGMENIKPPFRIVGPGRVFRYESTDASHENTF